MDCLFLPPACGRELGEQGLLYWQSAAGEGQWLAAVECAAALQGRPVALVLPMEVASSFLISLPTQKARWMRQALPYAVEEFLAEDVELFHLALGELTAGGRYRVFALRRALLSGWVDELQEYGLTIVAIHLDADLLPRDGEQALVLGERVLLGGELEARVAIAAERWPQFRNFCGTPVQLTESNEPYQLLAHGRAKAVDLAQGEFAPRSDNQSWTVWRPFVAVLSLWVVCYLGFCLVQAWQLERRGDAFNAASVALYKELFPADRRIVNLKAQFAEHLSQGQQSEGGFLSMLELASGAIAEAKSPLTVVQVDYSQIRGDLALQIRAKDFAELEQLRQRLVEGGLKVQLGSASREEQGITARVIVGGDA